MNAEEKRAFDAMMAEVGDSDSEDEGAGSRYTRPAPASARGGGGGGGGARSDPNRSRPASHDTAESKRSEHASAAADEEAIDRFGSDTVPEAVTADRASALRRWLMRPVPLDDGALQCFVERSRPGIAGLTGNVTYRMYLDDPDKPDNHKFFMAAKKKSGKGTSYYLVSAEMDPDDRGSDSVLGKVRANGVGSRYMFTDHGLAPDKTESVSFLRKELGIVDFEFDSGGPSKINAWVPRATPSGTTQLWQPRRESDFMEACIDADRTTDRLIRLVNKKPKWDEAHGGHVLNFQGRVTEASVKNFQLCCANMEDSDGVVLQFGRVAKDRFTLDLKYPMSPFQAFCICVACMDGKIADRKGYEYMRKLVSSAPRGGNSGSSSSSSSVSSSSSSSSSNM
jgi:tubby-related protein 1